MGKTIPATFLSVARQGFFFIPLVLILSSTLGVFGIQITQASADLLAVLSAIPIQIYILKTLPAKDKI
jgi:Na+-driven multidrug efflux pump